MDMVLPEAARFRWSGMVGFFYPASRLIPFLVPRAMATEIILESRVTASHELLLFLAVRKIRRQLVRRGRNRNPFIGERACGGFHRIAEMPDAEREMDLDEAT